MSQKTETETVELTQREIAIAEGRPDDEIDTLGSSAAEAEADDVASVSADASDEPEDSVAAENGGAGVCDDESGDDVVGDIEEETDAAFTEDDYSLGESYGLTRDEVEELGDRSMLERVGRAISRNFLLPLAKSDPPAKTDDDVKSDPSAPDGNGEGGEAELTGLDLSKIDLEDYDEVTQSAFKAIDSLQKEIRQLRDERETIQVQQHDDRIEQFQRKLDDMDGEFYGKSYRDDGMQSKLPQDVMDRRIKLAESVDMLIAGYESAGRPVPPLETLVRDAHAITFRERVQEVESKSKKDRLKKQAARRQAAGNRVTAKPKREPVDDEEADIMRILEETEEAYQTMLEENGRE